METIYGQPEMREEEMLKKGRVDPYPYRCFAYAYKDIESLQWEELKARYNHFEKLEDREKIENDLDFVASFALEDPLRKGV